MDKSAVILKFFSLSAKLPVWVLHGLAWLIHKPLLLMGTRAAKTTRTNLQLCFPEKSEQERDKLLRSSLLHTLKTVLEMGVIWNESTARSLARIDEVIGRTLIDNAQADGKGVIIIAPHIGNWEVLGMYLGHHFQATCLYAPPKYAALDDMIYQARASCGSKLAPTNRKGISALLKALKSQGVVGILPDQEPDAQGGLFAEFFGVPALTMTLLPNLIKKSECVAVVAYAERLDQSGHFRLVFKPADELIYHTDAAQSVLGLNRSVEIAVKDIPEQYQWEYKRFKQRPVAGEKIYTD